MITRIVKMTFRAEFSDTFAEFTQEVKPKIQAVAGCLQLEMLRDVEQPNTFFTYSKWQSIEHLNAYRSSELFGQVWPKTKVWFAEKPETWTVESL